MPTTDPAAPDTSITDQYSALYEQLQQKNFLRSLDQMAQNSARDIALTQANSAYKLLKKGFDASVQLIG
jgi:hypothetical protein